MIVEEMVVNKRMGLQAKNATLFTHEASKYRAKIFIAFGDKKANAKSLLGVLSLNIRNGDSVVLEIDGDDESDAFAAMQTFFAG